MRRGFVVRDVEGPAQVVVAFFRKGYVRIGQPDGILRASVQPFHRIGQVQEYLVVSEFQQDLGVLNWLYNDIVTPTCHYLDEQGILVKTTEGIDPDYLEKEFLRIKK